MWSDIKSDRRKGVKKLDRQTDRQTDRQIFVNFNIDKNLFTDILIVNLISLNFSGLINQQHNFNRNRGSSRLTKL